MTGPDMGAGISKGDDVSRDEQLRAETDRARRMSDTIRGHIAEGHSGFWCAVRMSDGGSDGIVYDSRVAAINHQLREDQCCYVKIPPDDMPPAACAAFLRINRGLYAAGHRLIDPEAPNRELMMPTRLEDLRWMEAQIRRMLRPSLS